MLSVTMQQGAASCASKPVHAELSSSILPATARAQALAVWRHLQHRLPATPLMCSADWTETWLHHYGDVVPHRYVLFSRGDQPVAIVMLAFGVEEKQSFFPVQAWHLGTAGELDHESVFVEYNALLCDPSERHLIWQQLMSLLDLEDDWDELRLDGFAEQDLPFLLTEAHDWEIICKKSHYVNLEAVRSSGRELMTFFGDSTRKAIRQNLRFYTPWQTEWSTSVAHALEIFEDLVQLHQTRWQSEGFPGCYASARFTAFHRELLERLVPKGDMALFRVRHGKETLGCVQIIIDRDRALVYQTGRSIKDPKHSPGLIADYLAMQACLERGYRDFDFMAGDSMHKQRLTTHHTNMIWAVRRRPRIKYTILNRLRQIKRWLRSII